MPEHLEIKQLVKFDLKVINEQLLVIVTINELLLPSKSTNIHALKILGSTTHRITRPRQNISRVLIALLLQFLNKLW